jgi:hypothetical protein
VRISSSVRARQVSQGFINVLQEWSPMPLVGSSRLEFLLVHAIKLFVGATHAMKRLPIIARAQFADRSVSEKFFGGCFSHIDALAKQPPDAAASYHHEP